MEVMLIVEDQVSEEVMRRLVASIEHLEVYQTVSMGGVSAIRSQLDRFRNASKGTPHIILVDLDRVDCPVALLEDWNLDHAQHPGMLFRVAVREVEAWLLADRKGISEFLKVAENKVPQQVEQLLDPKQSLINLARRSRSKRFVEEMVPAAGSSASIGPFYNAHLTNFVRESWNVDVARISAPSLERAIMRLSTFVKG